MKVRLDGQIHRAKITTDNPDHKWEIRVDNGEAGTSFFSREEIENSDLQIVQCTNLEFEFLSKAGFQPPFIRD